MNPLMHSMASRLLAGMLAAISALHLYWAAGGHWGIEAAIPRVGGKTLFQPGTVATAAVAFLLAIAAAGVLTPFDPWLKKQFLRTMALVFALRAIGEFHYVGFFQQASDSRFAYWDTRLFSPLCVLLAMMAAVASLDLDRS